MRRITMLVIFLGCGVGAALISVPAFAHWCSNIFVAPSRIVVKPERASIDVGSGPVHLRVYLQNNFPYKLMYMEMTGEASGYTINVAPVRQDVLPGQTVSFHFTISGPAASNLDVISAMDLKLRFRDERDTSYPPDGVGPWRDRNHMLMDYMGKASPSASSMESRAMTRDPGSLNMATLFDRYPSYHMAAGSPLFGRTGIQQLIMMFGYRGCFTPDFEWRYGNEDCGPFPSDPTSATKHPEGDPWPATWQFPQNCIRAGSELAIRKNRLGSSLAAARTGAINAMRDTSPPQTNAGIHWHKCMGAVVGGYLHRGASAAEQAPFTAALENPANNLTDACKAAGYRALADSYPSSSCSSGADPYETGACAAAEGINGNYGPVNSILVAGAGDGRSCGSESCLYKAYMLSIVANHTLESGGTVPFYPDAGLPFGDSIPPPADIYVPPPADLYVPPVDTNLPPPPVDSTPPPPTDGPAPNHDGPVPVFDTVPWPAGDGNPPLTDRGPASTDQRAPGGDLSAPRPPSSNLDGGCRLSPSAAGSQPSGPLIFTLILTILFVVRRRA